jgi:hypothetical protein
MVFIRFVSFRMRSASPARFSFFFLGFFFLIKDLSSLSTGASLAAFALFARADNVQGLVALLSPLVIDKGSLATVHVGASGLTFNAAASGKTLMATARLDASLFQEFKVLEVEGSQIFAINLATLVSMLQVFGPITSTTVREQILHFVASSFSCVLTRNCVERLWQ